MRRNSSDDNEHGSRRLPPIKHAAGTIAYQQQDNALLDEMSVLAVQPEGRCSMSPLHSQTLSIRSENPFVVPDKEDVFVSQKRNKLQQRGERERQQKCSVVDKTTFSSRVAYPNIGLLLDGRTPQLPRKSLPQQERRLSGDQSGVLPAHVVTGLNSFARIEKESMVEFISKKREIFLIQMQLDTKREEMRKLEADTTIREDQVRNSEAMLEEDALRFDSFLKENDLKVQEAVKRAEAETKTKSEKTHKIKTLIIDIEAMESELSKYEEQLHDCMKYMAFIDSLTPPEFFHEHKVQRELYLTRKTRDWEAEVHRVRQAKLDAVERAVQAQQAYANAKTQQAAERAEKEIQASAVALREAEAAEEPPCPQEDDCDQPAEDLPELYFTDPKQLLAKYKELESKNLFLIQNIQEIKEELEDIQSRAVTSRGDSEARITDLQSQENNLQQELSAEWERVHELSRRIGETADMTDDEVDDCIESHIYQGVRAVYTYIGFEDDHSAGVLTMLKNIENKVEEHLRIVNTMADEFVESAEKQCEKERRKLQRAEKIEEQRLEREARLKTAMERAKAPIHKKQGKPNMFRSHQIVKKEVVTLSKDKDVEIEDLQVFLARPD